MDREGFRNRLKQYKQAREENPGLKYWEWKNIPKYDEGTGSVGMPSTTSADGRTKYVYYNPTMDLEYQNIHLPQVTVTGNKNAGKRLPMQVPKGSYDRFKTLGEIGKTVGGFIPVAGEMIDTYDLVTDIKNKDWTNTAIRVGGYLMPNILEKGLSFGKNIYNAYKISKRIDNVTSGLVKNKQHHLPSYTLYQEPTRLLMQSVYDDELNKFAKASVDDIKKFYWSDDYRKRLDNAYRITGDKRFDNNFIPSQMVSTLDNVLVTADNEMESLGITGWDKISNRPTIRINKDIHYKNGYSIRETMDHEVAHASGKGTVSKIRVNDFNKSIINLKPATEIASEFNVQNFDELTKYMNHEMYDTDVEELRSRAYSVLQNAKWLGKEIDDYVDDAPMKDDQLEDLLRVMPKESVKHFIKNFLSGAGIVYTGANTFKNKSIENHQNK